MIEIDRVTRPILPLIPGVWLGLVIGISFIEAPLKFQAPGITTELGLGIGRLVFAALNHCELGLSAALTICWIAQLRRLGNLSLVILATILFIVLIQTAYLLPELRVRSDRLIAGESLPASNLHWLYVAAELLKSVALLVAFFTVFRSASNGEPEPAN